MQKFTKTTCTLAALLASGTALTGVASAAEITGNVGATTDYIWRGNTQSGGDASLSGGIDIDFGNGLYAGTWVGSLGKSHTEDPLHGLMGSDDANYEQDLYVSYSTEIAGYPLGSRLHLIHVSWRCRFDMLILLTFTSARLLLALA